MNRAEALFRLINGPAWIGTPNPEDVRDAVQCLKILGLTQEDLAAARKQMIQKEVAEMRAKAAGMAAALADVDDWNADPILPEVARAEEPPAEEGTP